MKLFKASRYFDRSPVYDAYAPDTPLFKAQLDVYADAMRDGLTVQRRILECAPAHDRPARSVIKLGTQTFLVGEETFDYFNGEAIRKKFVLHEVDDLAVVKTFEQALLEQDGYTAYAARSWVKSSAETEESSGKFNQMRIYFSPTENFYAPALIRMKGAWHIVRDRLPTEAGFFAVIAEELAEPVIDTSTVTRTEYDHVTDTYKTVTTSTKVLRLRWQTYFEYEGQASTTFRRGDLRAAAIASSAIVAGGTLALSDGEWNILSTEAEDNVTLMHLRKV